MGWSWRRPEDSVRRRDHRPAVGCELLARFIRREDVASSEAAFAALVSRHGPIVLGICRRVLGDDHAAADAFQAVFLVLARKAPQVRVDDTLGRWLHGVSIRVSRRARAVARAERARVRALDGLDPPDGSTTTSPESLREVRSAIDEEIARLPGRYRSAVVLCYLEGLTQEQAARRLRCPVRTVESRLRRARERLRPSLARRGLAPAAWCSEMLAASTARAELPPALAATARQVAGAGRDGPGGCRPAGEIDDEEPVHVPGIANRMDARGAGAGRDRDRAPGGRPGDEARGPSRSGGTGRHATGSSRTRTRRQRPARRSAPSPTRPAGRSRAPRSNGSFGLTTADSRRRRIPPIAMAGRSSNGPGGRPSTAST